MQRQDEGARRRAPIRPQRPLGDRGRAVSARNRSCLGPAHRRAFGIRPRSRARSSRTARRGDRPLAPNPHDPPAILVEWSGPDRSCLGPAHRRAFGIRPRSRARSSRTARRGDRPPAPNPHDPPAILVEWSGPGTVPVSAQLTVARSGSAPVAGHGARAPHGAVIVRWRGNRAERVDSGSCTPSQRASARAERRQLYLVDDLVDDLVDLGRLIDAAGSLATRHSLEESTPTWRCRVGRA